MTIHSPGRRLRWWILLILLLILGLMLRLVLTGSEGGSPAGPPPKIERPPSHYLLSEEKRALIEVLEGFIADLQTPTHLSGAERIATLNRSLNRSAAILEPASQIALGSTAVFKFPLRRMAEELSELDPEALQKVSKHFTERGYRNGGESWTFDPLEEVLYQLAFHDLDYIQPVHAMQIMACEVKGDREPIRTLLERQNAGDYTKADTVRQFFTGNTSTRSGWRQMRRALTVLDPTALRGCTWAELGYGTGQIFEAVREVVGPSGVVIGVEIGPGYEALVDRISRRHALAWGEIKLVRGELDDCRLPAESVDIVHEAGIHVGVGTPETLERETIPWLKSVKKALRPGGIMVLDDCGYPSLEGLRRVMARAGFEELKVVDLSVAGTPATQPDFVAAFRKPVGGARTLPGP